MNKTTLILKEAPTVPLEAENLSPDVIAPLPHDAVAALPVFLGKRQYRLDDFFTVERTPLTLPSPPSGGEGKGEGEPSEDVEIRGDVGRVKWIGRGMTRGKIRIVGNAGMHLGAYMKGGSIEVSGSAGDWVGAEMTGGSIHIHGDAGGQIGAAYRGSLAGMKGGTILVEGSAGMEIGMRMKRGILAVKGPVRDFAGLQMKGGTLFLLGGAELRTGAWMIRGTIVCAKPIPLLPTFSYACTYQPTFLRLYAQRLLAQGFTVPQAFGEGGYRRYSGDSAVPGKGELLIWTPK